MVIEPQVEQGWWNLRRIYFASVKIFWGGICDQSVVWTCKAGTRNKKEAARMAEALAKLLREGACYRSTVKKD